MTQSKLTVVARMKAKPGLEQKLKQELEQLVAPTRAEAGCINYDLHQAKDNPGSFLFYENWTSEEALNQHLQTPHIKRCFEVLKDLLAEPGEISLWKQL